MPLPVNSNPFCWLLEAAASQLHPPEFTV